MLRRLDICILRGLERLIDVLRPASDHVAELDSLSGFGREKETRDASAGEVVHKCLHV